MHFVFLEFLEARVESTLRELRVALQPWKRSKSPIHVTVRGPYKQQPDYEYLGTLASGLQGQGVRIKGAGLFLNGATFSVFLRAESAVFRDIWWKPDFPVGLDNIQPHVTLFETNDQDSALEVLRFLKNAQISIHATSLQLSIFSSGQADLFGTRPVATPSSVQVVRDSVAIGENVIAEAYELGRKMNSRRIELSKVRRNEK